MGRPQSSVFSRSYNSFSGVDIKAVFANKVVAELQAISYSITREKAPIYTMGSADPRSFSRGKRGIAGTLVFIVFDRHTLLSNIGGMSPDGGLLFQSDIDDVRPEYRAGGINPVPQPVQNSESELTNGPASDQALASAWYVDQIPPFDVTLAAANEYGALAVMKVFGVELLNEGYGVSIDDMVSEQQFTYIARTIIGWTPVPSPAIDAIAGQGTSGGV
jgi:hypothetical protein